MPLFRVLFLSDAVDFIETLERDVREKVIYIIEKASYTRDPRLFKKLNSAIWEFRIRHLNNQYRLLAFWDKRDPRNTCVVVATGLIKKRASIPLNALQKARMLQQRYFEN